MKTTLIAKIAIASLLVLSTSPVFAKSTGTTSPHSKTSSSSPVATVKDMAITALINTKIAMDTHIPSKSIEVKTLNGVVTYKGVVNAQSQIKILERIAENTSGVKRVETNYLSVKPSNDFMSDATITTKIKSIYLKEKISGGKDIPLTSVNVETTDGIVYLSGMVNNENEIKNAIKLAQSVTGVKRVESSIKVIKN